MRRQTKQQRIEQLENEVRVLRDQAGRFNEVLNEARRRTIPILNMGADANFLPLHITKLDVNRDAKRIYSESGASALVAGRAMATIICEGDVIYTRNAVEPPPAVPKEPTNPRICKVLSILTDPAMGDNGVKNEDIARRILAALDAKD
jgi:hypothetical protein